MRFVKMAAEDPATFQGEVLFDEESTMWRPDPEVNQLFLRAAIQHLWQRKMVRGHIFLNEVYDELGLPRTYAGQLWGWWETDVDIRIHPSTNDATPWLFMTVERDIHKHLT